VDEATRLGERLARAEARAAELEARLSEAIDACVVLERLHGSTDHAEVLRAIQDVVINLVGSEELAIFAPTGAADTLAGRAWIAVQSFGVVGARLAPVPAGHGPVGRIAAEGRAWIAGDGPDGSSLGDPSLTACVPLVAEGRAVAVLAVWGLLPHKPRLRDADRQLLELLAVHGGRALFLTARRSGHARAA
jgi:hypothetical protein